MIGRFRFDDEVFTGSVEGDRVVVERGLHCDTYNLDELETLSHVTRGKIVCAGLNYIDHARELDMELPGCPIIFLKPPSAVIGHGGMIIYPPESRHVDYEAELAVVIGKRCRNVPVTHAGDVVYQALPALYTTASSIPSIAPAPPNPGDHRDVDWLGDEGAAVVRVGAGPE